MRLGQFRVCWIVVTAILITSQSFAAKVLSADQPPRVRRVLYNFDGDSCLSTKAGGKGPVPVSVDDVKRLIEEVACEGSRVDTIMVCVNAQVMCLVGDRAAESRSIASCIRS